MRPDVDHAHRKAALSRVPKAAYGTERTSAHARCRLLLGATRPCADRPKSTRGGVYCFFQSLLGQFTPGAYGSGARLFGRIAGPPDFVARDCDFTALLVSDIRLAAKPGPETASNKPPAIA